MHKIIFVTGGVVSSLGKGIVSATLGNLLQANEFSVKIKKLDPYLNVDPGTINPVQHGEVYVTSDGAETDLDLGHYERFTGLECTKFDNITSGKIYQTLIQKERRGDYIGQTVQVVPHVTDLIKEFILRDVEKYDFTICEIGGTTGDIEGQPFLESIRQIRYELGIEQTMSVHVTLLPYISASQEVKTKPTCHSVQKLMSYGIVADILVCRTAMAITDGDRKKLSSFCSVKWKNVIEAPDVKNIYEIPLIYNKNGLVSAILEHFNIQTTQALFERGLQDWERFVNKMNNATKTINIALVGKYTQSRDAYKSVIESLVHAATSVDLHANIELIDSKLIENREQIKCLEKFNCVVITGGFGSDGVIGMIEAIRFCREQNIPMLGICYGMQLSVIEFARNVAGIKDATSGEFSDSLSGFSNGTKIIDIMQQWKTDDNCIVNRDKNSDIGGTMRLGKYITHIQQNTLAYDIYQNDQISERHRHRYEVDVQCAEKLAEFGGNFSGFSPDGKLPEIFEIKQFKNTDGLWQKCDFFVTVQFHPEFNSNPLKPNPLFVALLKAGNVCNV